MNLHEAEELLPWWVAGTLPAEEAQLVQVFVDSGQISTEKIAELECLEESVAHVAEDEPMYDPAILQKVMSRLDDTPQVAAAPTKFEMAGSKVPGLNKSGNKKPSFIQNVVERFQWSLTPAWAKVTIAGQFAVLATVMLLANIGEDAAVDNEFGTASGSYTVSADLTVVFNPSVTEIEMRNLLQQHGATIVSGPTSLGMYAIDFPDGVDIGAIQIALEKNPVTSFVQPVAKP